MAQMYPPRGPGGVAECVSKVEIRVECKNLKNKDVTSKSDPCAVMYMSRSNDSLIEVGRTENIQNSLDPKFAKSFTVNYYFEEVQNVVIKIYDLDNSSPELSDDDFLGQLKCTLGEIVSNTPYTKPLLGKNDEKLDMSSITVRSEEIKEGGEILLMTFRATNLDNKDFLGKSDPFLEISKPSADGSWQVVMRTEVVKNELNPQWRPFSVPMQSLCGGDKLQKIRIDIYDWDGDGSHDLIGGFFTNVTEMLTNEGKEPQWDCINEKKKEKKKKYTNSGIVVLSSCKLTRDYSFLDFIFGGMQINFTVGIDFTASNGRPTESTSLHFINQYQPNEYMQAIRAVGNVCQDYDSDKMFPVLGFGAKIPPDYQVSHEFAVNFNPQNPFCAGIDGVLQAYMNCITQVQLCGPTNAAPIINHVARFAAAAQQAEPTKGAHAYFVLMLLTDGALSDMSNTINSIVYASGLPMSLIIVGVGDADFSGMQALDGDNGVLRGSDGREVQRDIVQFVAFRDFQTRNPAELARQVLAEVPKQVTSYFKVRGMVPNVLKPNPQPQE